MLILPGLHGLRLFSNRMKLRNTSPKTNDNEEQEDSDGEESQELETDGLTAYERERRDRIARNRKVLEGMGIIGAWEAGAAPKHAVTKKSKGRSTGSKDLAPRKGSLKSPPKRRSSRLDPRLKKNFDQEQKLKKPPEQMPRLVQNLLLLFISFIPG